MLANLLSLFGLIKELIDGAKAIMGFIEANRNEAWFSESSNVFKKLREAKTDEERKALGRDLANLWRGVR